MIDLFDAFNAIFIDDDAEFIDFALLNDMRLNDCISNDDIEVVNPWEQLLADRMRIGIQA